MGLIRLGKFSTKSGYMDVLNLELPTLSVFCPNNLFSNKEDTRLVTLLLTIREERGRESIWEQKDNYNGVARYFTKT